jgi:hypothetical protein
MYRKTPWKIMEKELMFRMFVAISTLNTVLKDPAVVKIPAERRQGAS